MPGKPWYIDVKSLGDPGETYRGDPRISANTLAGSGTMRTAEDILREKDKGKDIISVTVDTTIHEALKVMLENRIGSIVVRSEGRIVGIWTERDLMKNTVTPGFDPKTARIGDYMVSDVLSAKHTATLYQLLDIFLGRRLRHVLIEKNGEYVGILSTGDVVKADLLEKTEELRELSSMVNWQYYEDWRAPKK